MSTVWNFWTASKTVLKSGSFAPSRRSSRPLFIALPEPLLDGPANCPAGWGAIGSLLDIFRRLVCADRPLRMQRPRVFNPTRDIQLDGWILFTN